MRLSLVLSKWPKVRPTGHIWTGKHRMERKVEFWHKKNLVKDIEREKQNTFYCMNPAVTVDQERKLYETSEEPRGDQLWFQMRKARLENSAYAPRPISTHYDTLKTTGTWQKY